MASKTKTVPDIPFDQIERTFELGAYHFGEKWCPAVTREDNGYSIRVVVGEVARGNDTTTKWDYFRLDADGTVTVAPRGYAKDFKPGRITGLDEAVTKYAEPKGDEPRLRLPF